MESVGKHNWMDRQQGVTEFIYLKLSQSTQLPYLL